MSSVRAQENDVETGSKTGIRKSWDSFQRGLDKPMEAEKK